MSSSENTCFSDWLDRPPNQRHPLLPWMHTTEAVNLPKMLETSELHPTWCGVFKEPLLYLFYGKAAYRPQDVGASRTDWAYFPITFVFEFDGVGNPKRAFPFDTGAYSIGVFEDYFHGSQSIADFEISSLSDYAEKFVDSFFGDNTNYVYGDARPNREPEFSAIAVKSYIDLISATGSSNFDDRRSSLEAQVDEAISLTGQKLLAVVLPKKALDDPKIRKTVLSKWNATPITYNTYSGTRPGDYYGVVREKLTDFLTRRGLL